MVGAPFAAVITDRFGRRVGMFSGASVILVGMAITASASTIAQVDYLSSTLSLSHAYSVYTANELAQTDDYTYSWSSVVSYLVPGLPSARLPLRPTRSK